MNCLWSVCEGKEIF